MIGKRLGKWVVDKELGRGGMGRVYLAHEEGEGQLAAVKVLAAELAQDPGFLQRFQREINALSQLDHTNIIRLYESGSQESASYYAMEYVPGRNFEELLREQGCLPWREVLDAALQICPALKHAHDRGIIHRDLKPSNLLRTAAGMVKLTDFGIAKIFSEHHLTATGGIVGTAEFLSPEQAAGKPVTKRSDLYSLGVVLYTLLVGRPPFEGLQVVDLLHKHRYAQFDPPSSLVPGLPYEINEIVCQLLEKDPARRPADALVLQRQLEKIRNKLERKARSQTIAQQQESTRAENVIRDPDDASGAEQAALMSRLLREELERQKHGGPIARFFNNVWVLLPLFLICVGVLLWSFWPRHMPSAENLFQQGSELMSSQEPQDWDRAWREYLEPLQRGFPDHPYRKELEHYQRSIEDRAALRQAIAKARGTEPLTAAQRFYQQGLELCRQGDGPRARELWLNVVRGFHAVESEQRWVRLAEEGLAQLSQPEAANKQRDAATRQALQEARKLREAGKQAQAEEISQGLETLYRNDPAGADVFKAIMSDRRR